MTGATYGSLPFKEQIAFFRQKQLVPTERWNDLTREQHDAGFMVAGAMKADLLADLYNAVDKAIAQGTTFATFQKDFEAIVARHGWTGWTGEDTPAGRAWRARVIYDTNLRTSYQAGRWAQIQQVKGRRPYLIYKHSDAVVHPRKEHKAWDGLVVRVDDPWVKTHWPPNGWGCRCQMYSLSDRDLERMGTSGPDTPPDDGTYEWTDKKTGEVHTFPNGIDPFWDYTPGATRVDAIRAEIARKAEAWPPAIREALEAERRTAEAALTATLRKIENGLSGHPVEVSYVIDHAGALLREIGGDVDAVPIDKAAASGNIVTHYHTAIGSFSESDIRAACVISVAEMRAFDDEFIYRMAPPAGGWNTDTWRDVIEPVFLAEEALVMGEWFDKLARGVISDDQFERDLAHEIWSRVAPKTLLTYERKRRDT